jgi:hypothetical protein
MQPIISKLAWAAFILAGAPFVYFVAPGKGEWVHASAIIAVGLAMFFFAREPNHDERVDQLKLRAVNVSFVPALGVTLLINMVVLNPDEPDVVSRSLSAFDFAAITMLCSVALFYSWRWQDARPGTEA